MIVPMIFLWFSYNYYYIFSYDFSYDFPIEPLTTASNVVYIKWDYLLELDDADDRALLGLYMGSIGQKKIGDVCFFPNFL